MSEEKKDIQYSINKFAEDIVGKREIPEHSVIFDQPCELKYHCPVCKYESVTNGNFDERLLWSEYNGFIWCSVCNKDYPSVLCMPDVDKAIEAYLLCVRDAKELKEKELKTKESIDWDKLREEFFNALTRTREMGITGDFAITDFNTMPHNVFEWFKSKFS